jgi:hypothetical protein
MPAGDCPPQHLQIPPDSIAAGFFVYLWLPGGSASPNRRRGFVGRNRAGLGALTSGHVQGDNDMTLIVPQFSPCRRFVLAGCQTMTQQDQNELAGTVIGAGAGLLLADAFDANPAWTVGTALGGCGDRPAGGPEQLHRRMRLLPGPQLRRSGRLPHGSLLSRDAARASRAASGQLLGCAQHVARLPADLGTRQPGQTTLTAPTAMTPRPRANPPSRRQ